ncbi:MAG TPA: heavy metal-associated domain-containing protein, partial [Gillisia sp.]|nr:heavy metal-associated domain-containing protein [Gillisia sp.]
MTHIYKITGMTCNGCRSHVEKTLNEVEGVEKAEVDLEKAEAVIEMKSHIPLETFQQALKDDGGKYSISNIEKNMPSEERKTMTHTYAVTGMTCNGCRAHVEKVLGEVSGVTRAAVDLEKERASIDMERHIEIGEFQQA